MHSPRTSLSARRAFLERLVDDAGLFPPSSLGLPEALAVDGAARRSTESWMLGRFIVPASRFAELVLLREEATNTLGCSAIVDGANAARDLAALLEVASGACGVAEIEAIEVRLQDRPEGELPATVLRLVADIDASGLDEDVPAYIECTFSGDWRARLAIAFDALADARSRSAHTIAAKLRCGAVTVDGVPSVEQLAFAVGTLRALGIPCKATAGLHHPVRALQPAAGFVMHGFLNVIGVAALDYELDLDEPTRRRVLAEEDPGAFSLDDGALGWRDLRIDGAQVAAARAEFVHSYGSCSLNEPVDDLRALGILT